MVGSRGRFGTFPSFLSEDTFRSAGALPAFHTADRIALFHCLTVCHMVDTPVTGCIYSGGILRHPITMILYTVFLRLELVAAYSHYFMPHSISKHGLTAPYTVPSKKGCRTRRVLADDTIKLKPWDRFSVNGRSY